MTVNKLTQAIRGAGGGGKMGAGEARTPVEAPDTLHSVAYARVIDLVSEGECYGPPTSILKDTYLDETPIQNADDSFNFKNVTVEYRVGTTDQEPLPNFPEVESETAVGVALLEATPWTHAFSNLELTGIRIRLSVDALSERDAETGDKMGYEVEYRIELSTDGGAYVNVFEGSFSGVASTTFERSHAIDLPPATTTGWQVRVTRLTPDTSSDLIQDNTNVVSYTELIQANFRYPWSALVGLIVDASQFRSVPNRAYRWKGRIIRVPANYDPVTREYATVGTGTSGGIWDGTFKLAWTDNPAWIYYDMVTHPRYGMGHIVADAQVDKWALYNIAQYCDELVDDGLGGSEPRFTCSIYFQKQEDAYKVLQDLASVFRGISYWAAGMITTVADMPADPVYTYTNANVVDGLFEYSGTSRQARHTTALVGWSDLQDFGRGKLEYCMLDEAVARFGVQQMDLTAIGATSQGQAHRAGMWALLSEWLEPGTVSFQVGLDGVVANPGQFVRVADEFRAGIRFAGRVRAATTTVITPDKMPTVAIGNTLTVILPTGLAQTRTVSAVGVDTITVSVAYSAAPVVGAAWVVESIDLEAQLYRVVAVSQEPDGITHSILAVQKNISKFDAVDFGYVIQTPNTSLIPSKVVEPPASVTVNSYEKVASTVPIVVVEVDWDAVPNAMSYEVSLRRDMGDWSPTVRVMSTHYEVDNAAPGEYVARVIATSYSGVSSLQRLSAPTVVGPPQFTQQRTVVPVGTVFTIDASLSEQFKVTLAANSSLAFENVPTEKTLVVDVYNTGAFTLSLPAGVTAVAPATPYVASSGAGKHDRLGFKTVDGGATYSLRYDKDI